MDEARIDPELRAAARRMGGLLRPSRTRYRVFNAMTGLIPRPKVPGYTVRKVTVPRGGGNGFVRSLVFQPARREGPLPCLLYIHGGGYALGSPEASADPIRMFAGACDCVIVAPAYRRSMEAPYPAAIDDCHDVLTWICAHAEALGIRSDQIMVGGHSAGGGLAAALCLRARDRNSVRIAFQMPIYPMIDDRMETASATGNTAPIWNSATNAFAWDLYLRDLKGKGAPIPADAAPARATDFSGLPAAATIVGDLDPFLDETRAYVGALKAAGVSAALKVFDGGYHGFEMAAPAAAVSVAARQFLTDAFVEACTSRAAPQNLH